MSEISSRPNVKHIVNKINMWGMSMLFAGKNRSDVCDRRVVVEPQHVVKK